MENRDDAENNTKVSDSAYSNSCSNSQSRRSHSSKSTHSGSNSSGSSGYGGKQSTSGSKQSTSGKGQSTSGSSSKNLEQPPKKDKEPKKKKLLQPPTAFPDVMMEIEERPPEAAPILELPQKELHDGVTVTSVKNQSEKGVENMDIVTDSVEEKELPSQPNHSTIANPAGLFHPGGSAALFPSVGFACVVSLHDGIVLYTTPSLTTALGFPKDMWVGRSFLQFMYSGDHNTFRQQIADGLVRRKFVNSTQEKAGSISNPLSNIVCRLRRYKSLTLGFTVKDRILEFQAFMFNSTLKNIDDDDDKILYIVMQATPLYSAFKTPREKISKPTPFVIKHTANGVIEYVDSEAVPYIGYLPQDLVHTNALLLYHPDDLTYLCQVYETVIKEGNLKKSKSYRIKIKNGSYVKVESEWSTFICPWSRNVVFITTKNYIIEGPGNPDVFAVNSENRSSDIVEDEKNKTKMLREKIIRLMHEVPSKPSEVAKQLISKRCQDLESFMESLIEEQPKIDEELRLEIQEPDHSNFERDSVMLGGISPHHDYNDSKSSTETPLSYTQLNYKETLQRYFESHHLYLSEDININAGENLIEFQDKTPILNQSYIPMTLNCGGLDATSPTCDVNALPVGSPTPADYQPIRLTESSLNKHNNEMQKELMKFHRVTWSSSKGERDKTTNENRQKKKEHLARCNATYQPTTTAAVTTETQSHGVKRPSKQHDTDGSAHKQICLSTRQSRRRQRTLSNNSQAVPLTSTVTSTVGSAATHWTTPPVNDMGTFILGVGIPQQMPIMNPVSAMPGVFPVYYTAAPTTSNVPASSNVPEQPITSTPLYQAPAMPCMMYGQPMYGPPFMYSPLNQVSYPAHQALMAQSMQYNNTMNPLGLSSSNYEESTNAEPATPPHDDNSNKVNRLAIKEEPIDKTDGESSYSSFYSSFFKTESGSAEESGDAKKSHTFRSPLGVTPKYFEPQNVKKVARTKMEPPWMDQTDFSASLVR